MFIKSYLNNNDSDKIQEIIFEISKGMTLIFPIIF